MRNKSILGMLALMLLSLASCGGGDQTETAAAQLSKADYLRQGNAICADWQQKRSELIPKLNEEYVGKTPTNADREKAILTLVKPYGEATDKLSQLGAPQADAKQTEAIVQAMEKTYAVVKSDPLSALKEVPEATKANNLAKSYGLEECTF